MHDASSGKPHLSGDAEPRAHEPREAELRLTIGELAEAAGMTVRNVRNHQSRGLLAPPALVARTGYYGDASTSSGCKLIRAMQAEGFNLEAIRCLLGGAAGAPRDPGRGPGARAAGSRRPPPATPRSRCARSPRCSTARCAR